ncbi:MAG: ComF family protein [Deltaproteobacteria bacterium]|uniref:ComF family protein n=1 Tax=Candidatus Zymogenus saltonus TaxID=2844893 RepID=A0A9D8KBV5_9DELT|nr:ComF family protein [Candidatus Zymogenus saltonus]
MRPKIRISKGGVALKGVLSAVADLLFPPLCIGCGEILPEGGGFACKSCLAEVEGIEAPYCSICGKPLFGVEGTAGSDIIVCENCAGMKPPFDVAGSAFVYGGIVLEAVKMFKYYGRASLAGPLTVLALREGACFGNRGIPGTLDPAAFDLMAPVPLYRKRLYERGFNQSLEIAKELKRRCGGKLSINRADLVRTRYTVPQTTLSMEERKVNVKGAFAVRGRAFHKKRVLLVDDVFTTGSTVSECAKVLKNAGAERVGVFTLTRSVMK